MMLGLKEIIPNAEHWSRFVRNNSEQVEVRLAKVEVQKSPSIMFVGMEASKIPVVITQGERMMSPIYRDILIASILTVIFTTVPDVIFGLLIEFGHLLFEFFHTLFEVIESALDHLIEHFFHTERRQTQIIVFYIMISVVLYTFYRLCRVLPRLFHYVKDSLLALWEGEKTSISLYWETLSLFDKIKLVAICVAGITCYVLFGF
ncbi:hypothetical protein EKO24_010475 [Candidatus Methylobacter oryzae]|uniref:Uncharacterized protein n=1 Tax=Candidatus Methylobacter oryzae TaxID=2497749 RepID=A0ABY3CAE3_9GAMM|nr:hypothetical protein EKO24_010475 [Candidatus Methylobacter oryzae]